MKKTFLFPMLTLLLSVLMPSVQNHAAHLVGGQFTYTCLGDDNYSLRLVIFRDCNCTGCATFDDPANITVFDGDFNIVNTYQMFSPTITQIPVQTEDLCIEEAPNVCVEQGVYELDIALPPSANGYQIVYQRCCRNNTILNLDFPGETGSTYVAAIPPLGVGESCNNSSPLFTEYPPIVICAGSPLLFDHSAFDAEGDSLVYSLCELNSGASTTDPAPTIADYPVAPVQWAAGYSSSYPLASDPAMSIDSQTGQLTAFPNTVGQFVVGVCVSEYRDGELLSVTTRDFQFNVADCAVVVALADVVVSNNDTICPGQSTQLIGQVFSADTYFWEPAAGLDDPNSLTPTAAPAQTTTYTLQAINSAAQCGAMAQITIVVATTVEAEAGSDQSICAGQTVMLGGNSTGDLFSWSPADGLDDPFSPNPMAAPTQTTTYTLTVTDLTGACSATDAVTVQVGATSNPGDMPDGQVFVCSGQSTNLSASGASISGDAVMVYVLHTSPTDVLGTMLSIKAIGQFSAGDNILISPNTTYYVSSVTGPQGSLIFGAPDFDHPCTIVAPGTPVVFLTPLDLLIDAYCDWAEGIYYVTAHPIGGYPAYDNSASYMLGGDMNVILGAGESSSIMIEGSTATQAYSVNLIDDGMGCGPVSRGSTFICYKTPIELLRFTGADTPEGNLLEWSTASETDNDYFTIKRSGNGVDFQTIATVKGSGTSITQKSYELLDKDAPQGLSYYRLTQTDFNGTVSEPTTISVLRRQADNLSEVQVIPVPASDKVSLSFVTAAEQTARVQITGVNGQIVYSQNLTTNAGSNVIPIDISGFSTGMYFVQIETNHASMTGKLLKK